jgi:hypothetical protein
LRREKLSKVKQAVVEPRKRPDEEVQSAGESRRRGATGPPTRRQSRYQSYRIADPKADQRHERSAMSTVMLSLQTGPRISKSSITDGAFAVGSTRHVKPTGPRHQGELIEVLRQLLTKQCFYSEKLDAVLVLGALVGVFPY